MKVEIDLNRYTKLWSAVGYALGTFEGLLLVLSLDKTLTPHLRKCIEDGIHRLKEVE